MTIPPDGSSPYGEQPYAPPPPAAPPGAAGYPAAPPPPGYAPPGYAAPGYAPPGYGQPVYAVGPARPGTVTAAAVLSFIWGGLSILGSIITLAAGSFLSGASDLCNSVTDQLDNATGLVCENATSAGGLLIVMGIILILAAALLIWGGVVALSGKNGKVGVLAGGLLIVAQIISLIASGFAGVGFAVFGVIVPVLIIAFLLNTNAKAWFRAKGGQSF